MIKTFRKVVKDVEAIQLTKKLYDGKDLDTIKEIFLTTVTLEKFGESQLSIQGVEPYGELRISVGDWIVKSKLGKIGVRPDERFKELYEEI